MKVGGFYKSIHPYGNYYNKYFYVTIEEDSKYRGVCVNTGATGFFNKIDDLETLFIEVTKFEVALNTDEKTN